MKKNGTIRFLTESQQVLLGTAILLFTAFGLYSSSLSHGFVWDDDHFIQQNPAVTSSDGLSRIWIDRETVDFWPLSYTLFWAEWQAGSGNPLIFHIVNIFMHALCALLLWRILAHFRFSTSFLVAFLFLIHPVNVESVSWVFQTKTTMAAVFGFLSIFFYVKSADKRWYYAGSVIAFLIGLLSKSSIIMLPAIIMLSDYFISKHTLKKTIIRSLPFIFVGLLLGSISLWYNLDRSVGTQTVRPEMLGSRLLGSTWIFWFYIIRTIFPLQSVFVNKRWEISVTSWVSYLPVFALLAVIAVVIISYRMQKNATVSKCGFFYYAITIFPVLGFVDFYFQKYSLVADHYAYFSMPGIIVSVIFLIRMFLARYKQGKLAGIACVAVTCALFLGMSTVEQKKFSSMETLWIDTVRKNPDAWLAHNNLAWIYFSRNDYGKAARHYSEALRGQPSDPMINHNLGLTLYSLSKFPEAENYLRKAAELMPNALNHFDLARNFAAQGKENEAFKYFGKVLETDPGHAETYRAMGQIYAGKKEYESAIQNYRRAVALDSTSGALNDMGLSFQLAGQLDSALVIFKKTVEGSFRSPVSLVNLANILSLQREYKSAITYYRQAISLSPNYFKAWYNCALAHRELGEEKESAYCYQQAMRFQNSRY